MNFFWYIYFNFTDEYFKDAEGLTPLHYASSCGHLAVVRLLLQRGADPNIQDLEGDTPNNYDTDKTIQEVFNEFSVRK